MSTMKAIQILGPKPGTVTLTTTFPVPTPTQTTHLLIRVHAAGITADELSWNEVYNTPSRIPGHDISGVVVALGPEYSGPFSVGDEVYGMLHVDRGEGQAEYVLGLDEDLAKKPRWVSFAQAAALGIPVLTAWQSLFAHAGLKKEGGGGKRVLVTGASGAVGVMAVQLVRVVLGAEVVAVASGEKREFLRGLGASEVVDYRVEGWEEMVGGVVDAVVDTVGGAVLEKTWRVVKDGGVIVTVADPPPPWAFGKGVPKELGSKPGVKYIYFVISADSDVLAQVANLIDEGKVEALPVVEFPVSQAVEAWEYAGQRNRKGKVVINFVS